MYDQNQPNLPSKRQVHSFLPRWHYKLGAALAGLALTLMLTSAPAQAATIPVDNTTCTLVDAITAANTDTATGGCAAGSGVDTLELQGNVTLVNAIGFAGLPEIASVITINGNGFTIARAAGAPDFVIVYVDSSGNLTLNATTISGGRLGSGGGIANFGTLTLNNSTLNDNTAPVDGASSNGGGLSNVGTATLNNNDIDAFAFLPGPGGAPQLLLSVEKDFTLNGFGAVDDADILRFIPASYGPTTAGSYVIYFDGSDVGLDKRDEDVDAIDLDANGNLVISVVGAFKAQNVSGNDEDLFVLSGFTPGANTTGTWGFYFDGSDVGLTSSNKDIFGLWADHANSKLYLSTHGNFSVTGAKGDEEDIFICRYGSLGATTTCTFSLFWNGDSVGFDEDAIDGLSIGTPPLVTSAADSSDSVAVDDTIETAGDDANEVNPLDGEEIEDEEVTQNNQLFLPLIER